MLSDRSPEVLLGIPYNGAIDMWSLACVCAEMYLGLPLFPGVSQHNQLTRIVEMMGNPPDALIEGKNGGKYFTKISPSLSALLHSHNFRGQVRHSSLQYFLHADIIYSFSVMFVSFHIPNFSPRF